MAVAEIDVSPAVLFEGRLPEAGPDRAALEFANYGGLWRKALSDALPSVETDRQKRRLYKLINAFAGSEIRRRVLNEPGLLGARITARTPVSDDVDLFFKGAITDVRSNAGPGALQIETGADGGVRLRAADAVFADARARLGDALTAETPTLLIEAAGGVAKLTRLGDAEAQARLILPFETGARAAPAGAWRLVEITTPEAQRRLKDDQIVWARALRERGQIVRTFNSGLFVNSDSREPELAGLAGAIVGSALVMLVTFALSFPVGVATAIYLEEYAPKNRLTDFIEVNINNLAAVPSIIFGLLGLAVLLNTFGMPRSAPIVGGIVLALMTLPTIIIAGRAALQAVPPSIREAAIGVGASRTQAVFDHVLPLALPGVLTGAILGMARALGETAPLLMIGMVAFIADPPTSLAEPSSVLPVQIYLWADGAERAFLEKSSAAILVLLAFLVLMNLAATIVRWRYERRW